MTGVFALQCMECGQRRDPRVAFCPSCGGSSATEDPANPVPEGGYHYEVRPFATEDPHAPVKLRERMIALRQQQALLEGRDPPDAAQLGSELDFEQEMRKIELNARLEEAMANGPGTSGRWEANPYGLSGRVVRGYRHWRNKR